MVDTVDILKVHLDSGSGAPSHTAPKGSMYINTGASTASTRLYINTTGASSWASITTSA